MVDFPDHPVIANMERTGYPDGKEPPVPICPCCGAECEALYKDNHGDIVGCDVCVAKIDWDDIVSQISEL